MSDAFEYHFYPGSVNEMLLLLENLAFIEDHFREDLQSMPEERKMLNRLSRRIKNRLRAGYTDFGLTADEYDLWSHLSTIDYFEDMETPTRRLGPSTPETMPYKYYPETQSHEGFSLEGSKHGFFGLDDGRDTPSVN